MKPALFCRSPLLTSSSPRIPRPLEVIVVPRARESKAGGKKAKAPRCRTCGKTIRVPHGWGTGPAVRRHYWAKHPEVMQKKDGRQA
jgi:hypothetical protein